MFTSNWWSNQTFFQATIHVPVSRCSAHWRSHCWRPSKSIRSTRPAAQRWSWPAARVIPHDPIWICRIAPRWAAPLSLSLSSLFVSFTLQFQSQESCLSILTGEPSSTTPLLACRQPSTAPPPTREREHFTFDPPQSPKSARSCEKARSHFSFKEDALTATSAQARRASSAHYNGGGGGGGGGGSAVGAGAAASEDEDARLAGARSKKLRARERETIHQANTAATTTTTRHRISPSVSPSSSNRTSPKRERKRTTPSASTGAIAKINSAPPTQKEGNFFGSCHNQSQKQRQGAQQQQQQQQLSPSGSSQQQQRKYSSSSSSGGSSERLRLREAVASGTMFPFDREALDYERIQRECFAPSSATASTSSDSDEAENCSVYERKLSADIFQQYSRLTQQEQLQQQQQQQLGHERERERSERPPSRKNSKRIRPDSVIHTTIRENQQYVPQSDAFYPQAKSSSSPSDHSYAELNKFEDIANKFEQIPPKHGSNSTLNLHLLHSGMHSPGSESLHSASLSPTCDVTRKRSFKSKKKGQQSQHQERQLELELLSSGGGAINVTANPLEAAAVCKQPRATIVVQQVSRRALAPSPLPHLSCRPSLRTSSLSLFIFHLLLFVAHFRNAPQKLRAQLLSLCSLLFSFPSFSLFCRSGNS